jgi:Holliday junction resolvasome RuvABC endonuclease subunit
VPEKVFDGGLRPSEPVAVGIDQSLTGFAVSFVSVQNPSSYKTFVYKSPYHGVQRLNDIYNWLWVKLDTIKCPIVDIAMEGTVLHSQAALISGELSAVVRLVIWDYFGDNILPRLRTPLQVPPLTLKKYVAGKGNAKKQEMLLQIYKRYGVEFNDDNAADSYALARIATGAYIDEIEHAVQAKLKDPKYRDQVS